MKASRIYTAQEMRDVAQCLHYNSPSELTIEAAAMLRQAAEMRERLDEANRKVSALMNNHVTFTVDGKEYYQPFLSRDVKEISRILCGNARKEEK